MPTRTRRQPVGSRGRQDGEWARLVSAPILANRLAEKKISYRFAADHCGHKSHQHILRLAKGDTTTTTIYTAECLENLLDMKGLLFTRHSARTPSPTKAHAA
jgi:hypothetical protein